MKADPEEMFPVVDEEGIIIGEATRQICHDGKSFLLHPVVHLHVFNEKGELFLQKRSMNKDIEPGKWDTSVGGHQAPGETVREALQREAFEELGLKNFIPEFLGIYIWRSSREREFINSYSTNYDEDMVLDQDEITEGRFWNIQDIKNNIGKNIFTPNFEREFEALLIKYITSKIL